MARSQDSPGEPALLPCYCYYHLSHRDSVAAIPFRPAPEMRSCTPIAIALSKTRFSFIYACLMRVASPVLIKGNQLCSGLNIGEKPVVEPSREFDSALEGNVKGTSLLIL